MEKPDYVRIKQLETELGLVPLPSVVVDGTDPRSVKTWSSEQFEVELDRIGGLASKGKHLQAESALAEFIGTTYQRFIDDCTKNPRWWEE